MFFLNPPGCFCQNISPFLEIECWNNSWKVKYPDYLRHPRPLLVVLRQEFLFIRLFICSFFIRWLRVTEWFTRGGKPGKQRQTLEKGENISFRL